MASQISAFALLLILCAVPAAARVETGFLDRTVSVSGSSYRYQVYVPADFSSKKYWSVVLFLHGAGERGSDGLRQTLATTKPATEKPTQIS